MLTIKKLWRWLFPNQTDKEWEGSQGMSQLAASRRYRRERMIDEIFD